MPEKTRDEKIDEMYDELQVLKGNKSMGIKSPFERIFDAIDKLPCKNPEAECPKNEKKSLLSAFMSLTPIERIILALVFLILGGGGSMSIFQYLI